jgi:hypothetical protein
MARAIEVTVSPQGEVTVQTRGYVGGECLRASQFLEQALGVTTTDHKTAEYYHTAETTQQVQQ